MSYIGVHDSLSLDGLPGVLATMTKVFQSSHWHWVHNGRLNNPQVGWYVYVAIDYLQLLTYYAHC
jgi:hypothetical protein